jgi:hypothetical protein
LAAVPAVINDAKPALSQAPISGPGVLAIKVEDARKIIHPNRTKYQPGGANGKDESKLPFIVIEMDKNEAILRAIESNPATGGTIWGPRCQLYFLLNQ